MDQRTFLCVDLWIGTLGKSFQFILSGATGTRTCASISMNACFKYLNITCYILNIKVSYLLKTFIDSINHLRNNSEKQSYLDIVNQLKTEECSISSVDNKVMLCESLFPADEYSQRKPKANILP